jgi:hypothetical protein
MFLTQASALGLSASFTNLAGAGPVQPLAPCGKPGVVQTVLGLHRPSDEGSSFDYLAGLAKRGYTLGFDQLCAGWVLRRSRSG